MVTQFSQEAKLANEPYLTYGECDLELLTTKCASYVIPLLNKPYKLIRRRPSGLWLGHRSLGRGW